MSSCAMKQGCARKLPYCVYFTFLSVLFIAIQIIHHWARVWRVLFWPMSTPLVQFLQLCRATLTTTASLATAAWLQRRKMLCQTSLQVCMAHHSQVCRSPAFLFLSFSFDLVAEWLAWPSPTHSFIPGLNLPFCKSFPPQPFFFFFRTDYMDSPDFYCYFWAYPFLLF